MAPNIRGMIMVGSPVQWYMLSQLVYPLLQGAPGGQQALISGASSLGNSLCPAGAVTHFLPMAHLILSAARAYSSLFPSAAAKLVTKTSEAITLLGTLAPFLQHVESLVCEALYTV